MRYSDNGEKYHATGEVSNRIDLEEQAERHVKCWSLSHGNTYILENYIRDVVYYRQFSSLEYKLYIRECCILSR